MWIALDYFKANFAMLESEYPYTSHDWDRKKDAPSGDCQYSASKATSVKVKSIEWANMSLKAMKTALQTKPLMIAVAANNKYIHSYKSGIIDKYDCLEDILYHDEHLNTINHGVLAVGYGTDQATGLDYVLIKNSWNTTWGD